MFFWPDPLAFIFPCEMESFCNCQSIYQLSMINCQFRIIAGTWNGKIDCTTEIPRDAIKVACSDRDGTWRCLKLSANAKLWAPWLAYQLFIGKSRKTKKGANCFAINVFWSSFDSWVTWRNLGNEKLVFCSFH